MQNAVLEDISDFLVFFFFLNTQCVLDYLYSSFLSLHIQQVPYLYLVPLLKPITVSTDA